MIGGGNRGKPWGAATDVPVVVFPPKLNAAMAITAKIKVFSKLVTFWVKLPQRMPRHCRAANDRVTIKAIVLSRPASLGIKTGVYSPTTIAITASVAQVESQSLQPTTKPG